MLITVPLQVVDLGTAAFTVADLQARLDVVNEIFRDQGIAFTCNSANFVKGVVVDPTSQKSMADYMHDKPGRLLVMLHDGGAPIFARRWNQIVCAGFQGKAPLLNPAKGTRHIPYHAVTLPVHRRYKRRNWYFSQSGKIRHGRQNFGLPAEALNCR